MVGVLRTKNHEKDRIIKDLISQTRTVEKTLYWRHDGFIEPIFFGAKLQVPMGKEMMSFLKCIGPSSFESKVFYKKRIIVSDSLDCYLWNDGQS